MNKKPEPNRVPENIFPWNPGQNYSDNSILLASAFVLTLITLLIFGQAISYDFIQGSDDRKYIHDNLAIQSFSFDAVRTIFTTPYAGIYHPLTSLTWMIEYHFSGLNPKVYHLDNILLHVINVLLVFYFALKLSRKWLVAIVTALLFSVHPMHVESVASIADRKDLLYAMFYFLSLICYVRNLNIKENKTRNLVLSLLFFGMSLLSKPSAVTLPLVLFIIDYYYQKKINIKSVIAKAPFLALAFVFGLVEIFTVDVKSRGGFNDLYSFPEQILTAFYAFIYYIRQVFFPLKLSFFHPYPFDPGGPFPFEVLAAPVIAILFLVVTIWQKLWNYKKVFVGILFFVFNIMFVLHLPIGFYSVAERYSYLSYFGLFFSAGWFISLIYESENNFLKRSRTLAIVMFFCAFIGFGSISYGQAKLWRDGLTLSNAMVQMIPDCFYAYYSRGYEKWNAGDETGALADYEKAISLNAKFPILYYVRGNANARAGKYKEALADYETGFSLNPANMDLVMNRANVKAILGDYTGAINDFQTAISHGANPEEFCLQLGICRNKAGQFTEAVADLTRAVEKKEGHDTAYFQRGVSYLQIKDVQHAEKDFDQAIAMNPKNAEALYNKGLIGEMKGDANAAKKYYALSKEIDPDNYNVFFSSGNVFMKEKNYSAAARFYEESVRLNPGFAPGYYNCGVCWYYLKNINEACRNWKKASSLGYPDAAKAVGKYCSGK